MAIPGVPFKLNAQDMGRTDLAAALAKGMQTGFLPRSLPADLAAKQANTRSKNTYSDFMMPQAILKQLGNKEFVETTNPKQVMDLQKIIPMLVDYIKNNKGASSGQQNAPAPTSNLERNIQSTLAPAQVQQSPQQNQPSSSDENIASQWYKNVNQDQYEKDGVLKIPEDVVDQWKEAGSPGKTNNEDQLTPAARQGKHQATVEEAKKLGQNRATQMTDLESDYKNYSAKQSVYENIKKDLLDPVLATTRTNPLMGAHEMAWFAKEGTPEQQVAVNKYMGDINNAIMSTVGEFGSRMTNADLKFTLGMKIQPSDTLDSAKGKYISLSSYTKFMRDKAKETHKVMKQNPDLDQTEALEIADKKLGGDKTREELQDEFFPVTIDHNGQKFKKVKGRWVSV